MPPRKRSHVPPASDDHETPSPLQSGPSAPPPRHVDDTVGQWSDAVTHAMSGGNMPVGLSEVAALIADYSRPRRYHGNALHVAQKSLVGDAMYRVLQIVGVFTWWTADSLITQLLTCDPVIVDVRDVLERCVRLGWVATNDGPLPIFDTNRRTDDGDCVPPDDHPAAVRCICLSCAKNCALVYSSTCQHVAYCLACANKWPRESAVTAIKCPMCFEPVTQWRTTGGTRIWKRPDFHGIPSFPLSEERMCRRCAQRPARIWHNDCEHMVYCRECMSTDDAHLYLVQCPFCRIATAQWSHSVLCTFS